MVPPPGNVMANSTGKLLFVANSAAVKFTLVYTLRFCEVVVPRVICPSFNSSVLTVSDSAVFLEAPLVDDGAEFPPID
jgi:hypothetical protein